MEEEVCCELYDMLRFVRLISMLYAASHRYLIAVGVPSDSETAGVNVLPPIVSVHVV
jgi:hypothetical protein